MRWWVFHIRLTSGKVLARFLPAPNLECRPDRPCRHIIEQDHRAIKARVNAQQGFREFQAAERTIQGYEAMHIIRKGQVRWLRGSGVRRQNRFINELFEVAA